MYLPICHDTRMCFARTCNEKCSILNRTYFHDGECPFAKEKMEVTNGKHYPHNDLYAHNPHSTFSKVVA